MRKFDVQPVPDAPSHQKQLRVSDALGYQFRVRSDDWDGDDPTLSVVSDVATVPFPMDGTKQLYTPDNERCLQRPISPTG